jgi:hypothetical protein
VLLVVELATTVEVLAVVVEFTLVLLVVVLGATVEVLAVVVVEFTLVLDDVEEEESVVLVELEEFVITVVVEELVVVILYLNQAFALWDLTQTHTPEIKQEQVPVLSKSTSKQV